MKHFTIDEFRCKHCGELPQNGMNPVLLEKLDMLRSAINAPIIVTSGYRCEIHNRNVGGVRSSTHVTGSGADIQCEQYGVDYMAEIAKRIGFDGIGKYPRKNPSDRFIHVDVRNNGETPACYLWEG